MTQAARIVETLRTRWCTWHELQRLCWSQAPWKRVAEGAHKYLKSNEQIERKLKDGLVHLRVVRRKKS